MRLPNLLADNSTYIQEIFKKKNGAKYKAETWQGYFNDDGSVAQTIAEITKRYPETISRDDILCLAQETKNGGYPAIRKLFVACMIWGWGTRGIGIHNVNKIFSDERRAEVVLSNTLTGVKCGKLTEPYLGFKLSSCGPAFFTKFFYFIGLAYGSNPLPVILDTKVAQFLEPLCWAEGLNLHEFAIVSRNKKGNILYIRPYVNGYINYVFTMDNWAKELGCRADNIEYFMYSYKGNVIEKRGDKMGNYDNNPLVINLPKDKIEQLEKLARSEFGVHGVDLARFWIIDKLLYRNVTQTLSTGVELSSPSEDESSGTQIIAEERLKCPQMISTQPPVIDEKYWKDKHPSVLECALWYRNLLKKYYDKIDMIYYEDYIALKWANKQRVSVRKVKNERARIKVRFSKENYIEVVKYLNMNGLPVNGLQVQEGYKNSLLFKDLDLEHLKEKQINHEWTIQRIVPQSLNRNLHKSNNPEETAV